MNSLTGSGGPPRNLASLTSSGMLGGTRKADVAAAKPATSAVVRCIFVLGFFGCTRNGPLEGILWWNVVVLKTRKEEGQMKHEQVTQDSCKEVVQGGKRAEAMTMRQESSISVCLASLSSLLTQSTPSVFVSADPAYLSKGKRNLNPVFPVAKCFCASISGYAKDRFMITLCPLRVHLIYRKELALLKLGQSAPLTLLE